MQLKLSNPGLASVYGLPQTDCEYADAIRAMTDAGWTSSAAQAHVDASIASGAYQIIEEKPSAVETKPRKTTREK